LHPRATGHSINLVGSSAAASLITPQSLASRTEQSKHGSLSKETKAFPTIFQHRPQTMASFTAAAVMTQAT
jgi:hypothetical protein